MPPSARGYYMTLLSQQWIRMESTDGGGLPAASEDMYVLAGGRDTDDWDEQWDTHLEVLFPVCDDDKRRNPTLAEVWLKQRKRVGAMSAGGMRGAAARWGLQLQMGDSSVANSNAFTSNSKQPQPGDIEGAKKLTSVSLEAARAREEADAIAAANAAAWLRELPRAAADKVREELKRRLPFPDNWDLRKLSATVAPVRAAILTDLHKEATDDSSD